MDFKWVFGIFLLILSGCTGPDPVDSNLEVIGSPLRSVEVKSNNREVGFYNSDTGRILTFDVDSLAITRKEQSTNADVAHYVLMDDHYLIDLSSQQLSIFRNEGETIHNPVRFLGDPIAAAFNSESDTLILQDSLSNIVLVQLNERGGLTGAAVRGPIIEGGVGFLAGDLDHQKRLYLSFQNGQIAVADVIGTFANLEGNWSFHIPPTDTDFGRVNWLSPAGGHLLMNVEDVGVVSASVDNPSVGLHTLDMQGWELKHASKTGWPHLIYVNGSQHKLITLDLEGKIRQYSSGLNFGVITYSSMDFSLNQLTVIETQTDDSGVLTYNSLDNSAGQKQIVRFELSSLKAIARHDISDLEQMALAGDHVFSLHKSTLGKVQRVNYVSGGRLSKTGYNFSDL